MPGCECCKGGCCKGWGECENLTAADCEAVGGSFYGYGVLCGAQCCPPPDASLCEVCVDGAVSSACSEGQVCCSGECCTGYCCDGVCQEEPCPVNSCCFPNRTCSEAYDQYACEYYGGTYRPDTPCGPTPTCGPCIDDDTCSTLCVTGFSPFSTDEYPASSGPGWSCPLESAREIFDGSDFELIADSSSTWAQTALGNTGWLKSNRCDGWLLQRGTSFSTGLYEWGVTFNLNCGPVTEGECDPLNGLTCSGTATWYFRTCSQFVSGFQFWRRNVSGSYSVSGIAVSAGACT